MRPRLINGRAAIVFYSASSLSWMAGLAIAQDSTNSSNDARPDALLSVSPASAISIQQPGASDPGKAPDTSVLSASDFLGRDLLDPIELAPLTEDGRSVTIPDYTLTDLLFRYVNMSGQLPFGQDGIDLWKRKVPLSAKTQVLYNAAEGLFTTTGDLFPLFLLNDNGTVNQFNFLSGNDDITTLGGLVSFWTATAPTPIFTNDCDCRGNPRQYAPNPPYTMPDLSFAFFQNILQIVPSPKPEDQPEAGWSIGKRHGWDCSPRYFAQGQVHWLDGGGRRGFTYPKTHDVIQAQFEMVVDMLRDEATVATLQSMNVTLKPSDRVGARIVKVAGLPASALGNMHGFLTIRQYALYQALERGDHACPIPATKCGKFASNPCDVYPPRPKSKRGQQLSARRQRSTSTSPRD